MKTAPEKGSVFTFTVPLFGAAAQTRPPMILVAAVDEQTRREVRRLADESGYAVQEAFDGVEAVESALRLLPAAVVLDRVLPKLRAEEVADRLRANPVTQRVPLLVLAAEAELGDRARLFDGFMQALSEHLGVDNSFPGCPEPLDFAGWRIIEPYVSVGRSRPCTP